MYCTECMVKTNDNCKCCEHYNKNFVHAKNLSKAIKLDIKVNKTPELSTDDWIFIAEILKEASNNG